VIVRQDWGTGTAEELDIIRTYSTIREFQPYDLVEELTSRDLYRERDLLTFASEWRPTIEEYLEARHTQASFSRDLMGAAASADFDRRLSDLLRELVAAGRVPRRDGRLELRTRAIVSWGRPQPIAAT
jgi:hypothetical protein